MPSSPMVPKDWSVFGFGVAVKAKKLRLLWCDRWASMRLRIMSSAVSSGSSLARYSVVKTSLTLSEASPVCEECASSTIRA